MKVRVFQSHRDKQKFGDKAPWSIDWRNPDGKRQSKKIGTKRQAEKAAQQLQAQLVTGTYRREQRKSWAEFREEYERYIAGNGVMTSGSRQAVRYSLNSFERLIKPRRLDAIKTNTIDEYKTLRSRDPGRRRGSKLSPASINRELRDLKAVLRKAHDWDYLAVVPKFTLLKVPERVPRYMTDEHFAAIYQACDDARRPQTVGNAPQDWWRALLVMGYTTGWRISELLQLRRDHIDFETGVATLVAEETKAKRGERVPLSPVALEHLERIPGFSIEMFPLEVNKRALYEEFHRLQTLAGIHLPCDGNHEHSPSCHLYGFHDLRRACATMNADRLTPDALQQLMRHRDYQTTQQYIAMARQMNRVADDIYVPKVLRKKSS